MYYYPERKPKKPPRVISSLLTFFGWILVIWWFIAVLETSRYTQIIAAVFANILLLILGVALIATGVAIRRIVDIVDRDVQQLTRELTELRQRT